MGDREFIEKFKQIQITKICEKVGVNRFNLVHKKTSKEAEKKVADEIKKQVNELLND